MVIIFLVYTFFNGQDCKIEKRNSLATEKFYNLFGTIIPLKFMPSLTLCSCNIFSLSLSLSLSFGGVVPMLKSVFFHFFWVGLYTPPHQQAFLPHCLASFYLVLLPFWTRNVYLIWNYWQKQTEKSNTGNATLGPRIFPILVGLT